MLSPEAHEELTRQQYRILGNHSGVKVCGWTKNMIMGKGGCYKMKFYGILSNQCLQMTTSMSCANRCIFCWRGYKAPVATKWIWDIDDPQMIFEGALHAQKKLLEGYKGNHNAIMKAYEMSNTVKHVALSLNGEPIMYPRLNELLDIFNEKEMSTFLVTNGQHPQEIKQLKPITQLYVSLDAPNKELLKAIDKPLFKEYWQKLLDSLDALKEKKERTAVRVTVIRGMNDIEPENYAKLIQRADADFIEVKGYMFVGKSRERLSIEKMPLHDYVVKFTNELLPYLDDYEIAGEHIPSRVVLLAKKKFKIEGEWHTWIDFEKWSEQVANDPEHIDALSYSTRTPPQFTRISTDETKEELLDKDREEYFKVCEEGTEDDLEE